MQQEFEQKEESFVEAAVDLLYVFSQHCNYEVLYDMKDHIIPPVCLLGQKSNDNSIIQSCCECLRQYVRGTKGKLVEWYDGKYLLLIKEVLFHVLAPGLSDACVLFAGGLVIQVSP